jgi:L-asparaginase
MTQDRDLHIIATGGTISKTYDPSTEKPELNPEPFIRDYIVGVIKPHCDISMERVFLKDSADITDADRAVILAAVTASDAPCIMITHGTSTMDVTAEYLQAHLAGSDKTIVLTGAMIPLKEFAMSDAGFNLGFALSQVQALDAGVYICMNATNFAAGSVRKDVKTARFVAL